MENGIAKLLSTKPHSYALLLADDATFARWAGVKRTELWKLVLLHSHLDPGLIDWFVLKHYLSSHAHLQTFEDGPPLDVDAVEIVRRNMAAAVEAVQSGVLQQTAAGAAEDTEASVIEVTDFLAWSLRSLLLVAVGFQSRNGLPGDRFPWGAYTTPKIEALAEVAGLWRLVSNGGNYDPSRPETAPSARAIREVFDKHKLAPTAAEAIVSITRDPNLRPGPRAGESKSSS